MSWAKWDAEHRSAGVRVTRVSSKSSKVDSGGKRLGNVHQEGTKHVAVTKVGGVLQSKEFDTHHAAVNHIRATHGLPPAAAKKTAAPMSLSDPNHSFNWSTTGAALAKKTAAKKTAPSPVAAKKTAAAPSLPRKAVAPAPVSAPTAAKKTASPQHDWSKWDEEHGHGGGSHSSAEKIAAQIRGALGAGEVTPPKPTETRGRGGSVISRAEGSRSTASHITKSDLKRPTQAKGEKDVADSFRTRIRMAEYNRKKKAAVAGDPVDQHTPRTEVGSNPHSPAGLSAKADEATKTANFSPSVDTHHAAAKAHLYAAGAARASKNAGKINHHEYEANKHLKAASQEVKNGPTITEPQLKKLRTAATAATAHAKLNPSEAAHRDAAEAHARASYAAASIYKPVIAKGHLNAAKQHSVQANDIAKNTTPGSSSGRIAALIKSMHVENKKANPEPVVHVPGGLEDRASLAEAATAAAHAAPDYNTHKAAAEAHREASAAPTAHSEKAVDYHRQMASYHDLAATKPSSIVPPEIHTEHTAEGASRFPSGMHQIFSAFRDTFSRRRSQKMYDSVPKASEADLSMPEKTAISNYTSASYISINNHLRGLSDQSPAGAASIDKTVKNLDAAFEKQPGITDDLITYRGVKQPELLFGKLGEKVGAEFQDHGYGSSASHAEVGSGFGSNTGAMVRILHPKGSKLLKPSNVGKFGDSERELLIPRGTKFHVAADRIVVQTNGTKRRIIDLIRQ